MSKELIASVAVGPRCGAYERLCLGPACSSDGEHWPRPAGSPQAQAASEYVAAEMRKLGLDVHLEEAHVSHWVRGEEKAELVEFPGQPPQVTQKIIVTALSGGTATPAEGITATW